MADMVRVTRSKASAKAAYDRMSGSYDRFAGRFEKPYTSAGVDLLGPVAGEAVLEIGFGTGTSMVDIARRVGSEGHVFGLDLSTGMCEVARAKVDREDLSGRVAPAVGDAERLPFAGGSFDAVSTSFTLELFDTPDIPVVLAECRRVLRPGGWLGVVAMALAEEPGLLERLYVWSHRRFPDWVDCRPIPADRLLTDAGFELAAAEQRSMWGLPVWLVVGRAP